MSNNKRTTLQDEFNNSTPVLGKKSTFRESYPEIESIDVYVTEYGEDASGGNSSSYNKENMQEFIGCSNHLCNRGGLHLMEYVRDTIRKKEEHFQIDNKKCKGDLGSPKGKKRGPSCYNFFSIEISIKYVKSKVDPVREKDGEV